MAESDPLTDMFNLVAAPLAGTIRSVEQFRRGVDEFLRGVENFNRTMENLNETAERVNSMLIEVEEPLRAAVPQLTRTIQTADEVMTVMSGPAKAVAPGLTRLAEVLDNPAFVQMPNQIGQVNELLGELANRLAPLGQVAGAATGVFGGLRLPGMTAPRTASAERVGDTAVADDGDDELDDEFDEDDDVDFAPPAPGTRKKVAAKKSASKKAASKKKAAKKKAAAKRSAKKTAARRSATADSATDPDDE